MTSINNEIKKGCIVNQNDMYLYFETINQIEPDSIIDIGMFLKRIGAISRQVKGMSVADNILMDGIDCMYDLSVKIYEKLYNNISDIREFTDKAGEKEGNEFWSRQYDLAFMLRMESVLNRKSEEKIWRWLSGHVRYAVINGTADRVKLPVNALSRELNVENDTYSLVSFVR